MAGSRKVTINVLVFLLPPESSLTVMLIMSVTPCVLNSVKISGLSQSTSSRHLMTPLQVLSVLCALVVTGRPARLLSFLTARLCAAEET